MENKNKLPLYLIIIVLTASSVVFRLLGDWKLEQTSLLFIGLPALISILLIRFSSKPKSAYGVAFLTVTLFLLISGIFLGEGFVCILFMAPLFYGVVFLLILIYKLLTKNGKDKMNSLALLPLLMIMLQPSDFLQPEKIHHISTQKIVASDSQISDLNTNPNFTKNLPAFFKIGFPKPVYTENSGLKVGDTRRIDFKSTTKGVGSLVLEVKEISDHKIVFDVKKDDTHIHHWLTYKEITVELTEMPKGKQVVWTTDFTCDLGPSWYFEASEKYAIQLMNEHLINTFFEIQE